MILELLRVNCCLTLTEYHQGVSPVFCMYIYTCTYYVNVYMYIIIVTGQYTTGRGSSGVGLTAAVMRDPLTSEMTLGIKHSHYGHLDTVDTSVLLLCICAYD